MGFRNFVVAVVVGGWLLPTSALADALKLAGPPFPPYYVMDGDRMTGPLADILTRIVTQAGHDYSGAIYPPARLMTMLNSGGAQVSLLVRNQALDSSPSILRSPQPITEMVLNVYSAGRPERFQNRQDLAGRELIVMRGYGYGGLRSWLEQNGARLQEVNSFGSALRLLESGRMPLALLYDVNYQAGVAELGRPPANVFANALEQVPLYIYLHKSSSSDSSALMDGLMKAWKVLVDNGTLGAPQSRPEEVLRSPSPGF